jgi:SAM-dependent methyltransferase
MQPSGEFSDPRLVAIYDAVNAYQPGTQPDFYAGLAERLRARSILDVGCGTGLITCKLAARGHRMVGIDPSPAMLEQARRACSNVDWRVGRVESIGRLGVDLAIMTGHVAQFFISDDSWMRALGGFHRAIRYGGTLAFETRDPHAREWEQWTRDAARVVVDVDVGRVECWSESQEMVNGVLSYSNHYRFLDTGEEVAVPSQLRFRSEGEIRDSLGSSGFEISAIFGDWDRRPTSPDTREYIVVATAGDLP